MKDKASYFIIICILVVCLSVALTDDQEGKSRKMLTDAESKQLSNVIREELNRLCEYCDRPSQHLFQELKVEKIEAIEIRNTTYFNGTMYILEVDLSSSTHSGTPQEDTKLFSVFKDASGSFTGIGFDKVPFLEE